MFTSRDQDAQTMTARVGWSKSVLEALALPILSLVPVQVVFALRRQLSSGDAEGVRRLLAGDRMRGDN